MTSNDLKQTIHGMLLRMNVAVERIEVAEADGSCRFAVTAGDSPLLIGPRGAHLYALNHIIRKIAAKGGNEERDITVDINGYQEAAAIHLKNMAKIMGERARSFKSNITLDPMSSYERMIIHSFFQDAQDLVTQSVGEGENRRVVIKYVEKRSL